MKHYGDITKINGSEIELVDVITGGSPCQDLSVAGKRAGLAGERSGLFMEQIRIIKELRNECIRQLSMRGAVEPIRPRYMVWENVVGAFSSNNGEDFRAVLEETAKIKDENAYVPRPNGKWANAGVILGDGFSIAWRVHDAQYWGVPQRRRRICLLADFNGDTAPKILFELRRETIDTKTEQTFLDFRGESQSEVPIECESLQRNLETSGESWQGTPTIAQGNTNESISFQERAGCPGGGKGILIQNEKTASLSTLTNQFVCNSSGEEIAGTLDANYYKGCGTRRGHEREVVATYQDTTGSLCASGYDKLGTQEAMNDMYVVSSSWDGTQVSPTLTAHNANGGQRMPDKDNFNAVLQRTEPILLESNQNHATVQTDGISTALPASMGMGGGYVPMVTEHNNEVVESFRQGSFGGYTEGVGTLRAKGGDVGDGGETLLLEKTYQNVVGTLDCGIAKGTQNQLVDQDMFVTNRSVVRRLTPLECERLQGFPDDHTNIGEWVDSTGKKHKPADSPRYKALGNSIALPFWSWLAERIVAQLKEDGIENPTMGSLFDGIGGFPLVFQRAGCKPIWASEIEEFPIAVTKRRFPEESEYEETNNQLAVSGNDPDSEKRGQLF